jgi:hypothetical protein
MYQHGADAIHGMCGVTYAPAVPDCDNVSQTRKTSSQTLYDVAGQSDVVTNSPVCSYEANGSPVQE